LFEWPLCLRLSGIVKNKNIVLVLGLGILIAAVGFFFFLRQSVEEKPIEEPDKELIGGNRDEHGCLGPAGYSYDEEIGVCIRSWELSSEQYRPVQMAVEYLGREKGLTLDGVIPEQEGDGYLVLLQKADSSRVEVEIKDDQVVGVYPVETGQSEASESAIDGPR